MSCARLYSLAISNLYVTRNSRNSLTSCSAYSAQSCDRVILPLSIMSDSRVATLCCSNNPTLACMVSMSSPVDSICYRGGEPAIGGSDGEGDLDLLRDEDGKSDGGGEDDDVPDRSSG
ncbi:hypothetical protein Tco_0113067 [Tanacetum coccineum]